MGDGSIALIVRAVTDLIVKGFVHRSVRLLHVIVVLSDYLLVHISDSLLHMDVSLLNHIIDCVGITLANHINEGIPFLYLLNNKRLRLLVTI